MILFPVPSDRLGQLAPFWRPFVEKIAERSKDHPADLIARVLSNEVQPSLIWDEQNRTARALIGTRIQKRGDERRCELIWCTGDGRDDWLPLLSDVEAYHAQLGCSGIAAIARPGWSRALKERGYRMTHVTMEKDF